MAPYGSSQVSMIKEAQAGRPGSINKNSGSARAQKSRVVLPLVCFGWKVGRQGHTRSSSAHQAFGPWTRARFGWRNNLTTTYFRWLWRKKQEKCSFELMISEVLWCFCPLQLAKLKHPGSYLAWNSTFSDFHKKLPDTFFSVCNRWWWLQWRNIVLTDLKFTGSYPAGSRAEESGNS